ncbi:ParM/StbA family protein [Desulforamulus ruminis]|uniref:Uncharacterized protein n=1 Tax=Desulforamulus ruminis (strain ATCC 23193 / DSM 2154 / NCIMB 8452 / DL) TaxID=696281 RepID=F6DTV1_DESRL|nr:ParM/StbA family protein [Desulforamulus ruminis]AEG58969.1 hypothetical protein Desru_0684 [Desulforamulus ruminis DSM 2154]
MLTKILAIDVGYSHVKAVSTESRILIPSIVSPYQEMVLADLSSTDTGHLVKVKKVDGTTIIYFVGELAVKEGRGATFTLDRQKHKHPNHDILVLTASRILEAQPGSTLGVGLPVAYYRTQREELIQHLMGVHGDISVNDSILRRISFGKVIVYPQGAAALITAPGLPQNGLVLLVDVGYKTTDYIVAEVVGGKVRPVSNLCGSVETGIYAVHETIALEYQNQTGMPLSVVNVPQVLSEEGKIIHYGREIDFNLTLEKIKTEIAMNIVDQVTARLGERMAFVRKAYLAGGGAKCLPVLSSMFPVTTILPNAQWANAEGILAVVKQTEEAL